MLLILLIYYSCGMIRADNENRNLSLFLYHLLVKISSSEIQVNGFMINGTGGIFKQLK